MCSSDLEAAGEAEAPASSAPAENSSPAPAAEPAPAAQAASVSSQEQPAAQPEPAPAASEAPAAEPAAPEAQGSPKEIALSYVGRSAAELAAAIGQPTSTEYATSCIGDGEDGIWYYDGFTVYTFRGTDGSERVEDVF